MAGFVIEGNLLFLLVLWLVLLVLLVIVWSRRAIRVKQLSGISAAPSRPPPYDMSALAPDVQAAIAEALRERRTIDAIKLLREATGMDLVTAKDAVDSMADPN